ncbi:MULTISPECIES: TetR/AcrR family transcriptional regulator [Nonomuraea]|uniref:TetR/AcrR family transcriptional regulator n=1 Tax=Nonomuraea mangrovi TaxID=2316207 RepID=A0ABW4SU98_9ACTN
MIDPDRPFREPRWQIAEVIGVRDSAIYAHFPGKQAIYDELFAEGGPPQLEVLDVDVEELAAAGPRLAVPDLIDRLVAVWSSPRMRLFSSVVLRDGSGAGGLGGLSLAIEDAKDRLEPLFRRWQEAGLIRADLAPRQLVWELFAPLQVPRFLFLRADATDADVATARRAIDDHVAFFLTCVTPSGREGPSEERI